MRPWILILPLVVACGGDTVQTVNQGGQGDPIANDDEDPPEIEHTAVSDSQYYGEKVELEAIISDVDGQIFRVEIYYKSETDADWLTTTMAFTGADDIWRGSIPGNDVYGGGMHYYIVAIDDSQNEGFSPEDGASDPYRFRVTE